MFGERHDLPHEFPEYSPIIDDLLANDEEFRQLNQDYNALDDEILKIEQNVEPVSDAYAEELKMKRVHLKDRLYDIIRHRAAEQLGR